MEATNFVEDTWFGENGYFHSDAMSVIERLTRQGDNILYEVTVDDPKVLTQPWTMNPRQAPTDRRATRGIAALRRARWPASLNSDHHQQR